MERRDLLRAAAATALTQCAPSSAISFRVPAVQPMSSGEVDAVLADLDATLERMSNSRPARAEYVPLGIERSLDDARAEHAHSLTMRTLAAMHVSATFTELPVDARLRPEVQRRMWRAMPLMDDAMLDMTEYLHSLTPSERRALQEELRKNPSRGMDAVGVLDDRAASFGVSSRRRAQMRMIAANTSWRMTRQSVDAVIDDALDKVRRIGERHGRNPEKLRVAAAKIAEARLFDERAGHSHVLFAADVPTPRSHRGGTVLALGGVLLGIGAGVDVAGGVLVSQNSIGGDNSGAWFGGAVMLTVGSVIGLMGLIALIVGGVLAAQDE